MPSESKEDCSTGTLLSRAVNYYRSNKLSEPLESFARLHAAEFEEAVEEDSKTGEPLHKLEYTQLHQVYLSYNTHRQVHQYCSRTYTLPCLWSRWTLRCRNILLSSRIC
jgi:hypothetical protein